MSRWAFNNSVDYLDLIQGLGIVRFDCGKNVSKNWVADTENSYCLKKDGNIHERISEVFKQNIYENNPINFLVKYYNQNPDLLRDDKFDMQDIDSEFSFCIRSFTFHVKDEYLKYKEYNGDEKLHPLSETSNRNIEINISDFSNNAPDLTTNESEKFKYYQQIFTDIVGKIYNKDSQSKKIKYVTVILFVIKQKSVVDFSNFVIIFHRNEEIIKENTPDGFSQRNRLKAVLQSILQEKLKKIIQEQNKRIKNEATKSAKVAIMSRNMSHNLGSHVMFYIKQKLKSVEKIKRSEVLHNLYNINKGGFIGDNALGALEMPFLVGMGRFFNYLQERQDYIATVATDYVSPSSTINFKDFIYDELKPELRYSRHKKKDPSSAEIKGTEPKNLLMDYIAFSEGYESSNDIQITFGKFNGYDVEYQPSEYSEQDRTQAGKDFQQLRNLHIAVPGGVIGRQAIFSIIENIIRNAAKHSDLSDRLCIGLDIIEGEKKIEEKLNEDEGYKCKCAKENSEDGNKTQEQQGADEKRQLIDRYKKYSKDYIYLCITNRMGNRMEQIDTIIKGLNDDYIDDGSCTMRDQYKGIKEMRISAAWLRGYWIDTVIPNDEPPVISVRKVEIKNNEQCEKGNISPVVSACADEKKGEIGNDDTGEKDVRYQIEYLIALQRPKSVAILIDGKINEGFNKRFEDEGCASFSFETFLKQKFDLKQKLDIAKYNLVISDVEQSKFEKEVVPYINARYVTIGTDILKELLAKTEINVMEGMAYRLWFDSLRRKSHLIIADAKAVNEGKNLEGVTVTASEDERVFTPDAAVYVKHFTNMSDDPQKSEKFKECCFIEGVTGSNSTDRLIRQDEWTETWKYKHLGAAVTRVAIFDERISSYVNGKEQITPEERKQIIQRYADGLKQFNQECPDLLNEASTVQIKLIKYVCACGKYTEDEIQGLKDYLRKINTENQTEKIFALLQDIDNFTSEWFNHTKLKKSTDQSAAETAQHYRETNVWVYNIERYETAPDGQPANEKWMRIVGYTSPVSNRLGTFDSSYIVRQIGVLKMTEQNDQKKFSVEIYDNNYMSEKFDFISIHQGILDKVYTEFGVKGDNIACCKITWALHKYFSTKAAMTPQEWTYTTIKECSSLFLPQFIIHSGRSKPSKEDMPQKQPFAQFAAIDHAVRDCKYTLSELLFTMHYEPNSRE